MCETLLSARPRRRTHSVSVGVKFFKDMIEYDTYFRCGKHRDNSSPCVQQERMDLSYPVVYEEWQKSGTSAGSTKWFRCRRQRRFRRKGGAPYVNATSRVRHAKEKTEYIGCDCMARFKRDVLENGEVRVEFFNHHNHCCQQSYKIQFLNPIEHCSVIREIVDSKLFAGVRSAQSILASILPETLNRRGYLKSFEALRVHNMTFALKKSQIYNRREQLGLNSEKIAHKYEHLNIYEHPIYEHLRNV